MGEALGMIETKGLVARLLGGENLIAREEVMRLQQLRGSYGIKAPAPICADGSDGAAAADASCQTVQAPSGHGARLVPDSPPSLAQRLAASHGGTPADASPEAGEIRLTYRELSALIEEAVRSLR